MSRSTPHPPPADPKATGTEAEPRFRSYFDLLEAKYANESQPPPAYQPASPQADPDSGAADPESTGPEPASTTLGGPGTGPGRREPIAQPRRSAFSTPEQDSRPARGPSKRRSNKLWILGFMAAVIAFMLLAFFWSRPSETEQANSQASVDSPGDTLTSPDTLFTSRPSNAGSPDGTEAPSAEDPGPRASVQASEALSRWTGEAGQEPTPIAVSFPELESASEESADQQVVSNAPPPQRPGQSSAPLRPQAPQAGLTSERGPGSSAEAESVESVPIETVPITVPIETVPIETVPIEAESVEGEQVVASNDSFEPPQKVFSPQPTYPERSRQAREQGTVVLEGTITADGDVRNARVRRSASPTLDRVALEAFRTWQFQPALRNNIPVDSSYRLAFRFSLEDPPTELEATGPQEGSAPVGAAQEGSSRATAEPGPTSNANQNLREAAKGTREDPLPWRGDFTPPSRFVSPLPSYPQSAWATGAQGTVTLEVVVDRDGRVTQVEVLEGLPHGISEAAVDAVRRWRFRPATRDGEAVAVFHRLTLRFAP